MRPLRGGTAPAGGRSGGRATAFQAMGIERVKEFLETHKDLKVYFIYEDENQELQTLNLNGFPED